MGKNSEFKTTWRSKRWRAALRPRHQRPPGFREKPELVRLGIRAGLLPSSQPPVRIFIGTEPRQHRAERILLWSIEQARDPAREYQVYLMKELAGFDRSRWKTGFTMYRFAIPELAGGAGRAIYNDVDQVYLADPAELFDLDMNGHGFLSVSRRDTSVMLIDCARMAPRWRIDAARHELKKYFRARAQEGDDLWGPLPPEWNARDHEYTPGVSKLFHFTTLQMQPWRPFPDELVYEDNPNAEVWLAMERAADAAGYQVFTRERPSGTYEHSLDLYREMHAQGADDLGLSAKETFDGHSLQRHIRHIARLVEETGARTLLDYGAGKGGHYEPGPSGSSGQTRRLSALGDVTVHLYDPAYPPCSALPEDKVDGVYCTDVLEHVPEEDIPWIVDELFRYARRFVYAAVTCYPARKTLPDGRNAHCTLKTAGWWRERFAAAARRHPEVRWELRTRLRHRLRGKHYRNFGGAEASAPATP